jgi:XrtN system VIT domain protein
METNIEATTNPNTELVATPIGVKEFDKSILYLGYLFLAGSCFLYVLSDNYDSSGRKDFFTLFILHYIMAIAYAVTLFFYKAYGIRKSWRKENLTYTIILLNLFLVSAYALNREMAVFQDSTDWLCGYLILTSLTLLSYHYFDSLPRWINKLQHFLLGSAMVLYLYLSLFVAEMYPFGGIGIIFFGIGAHIFVPLTLLIGCIFLVIRAHKLQKVSIVWAMAGSLTIVLFGMGFAHEWDRRVSAIEALANQSVMYPEATLPVWIKVGQSLPNDWITQRILKGNLVYTVATNRFNGWSFFPEDMNWDEKKKHDPFVFLSSLRSVCNLPATERIKILQAISDTRYRAQERLWSGDNLSTSYIVSDIDIYPHLRLAYTEKYLNIKNNATRGWWGNTQEAIYSFQLPEGSVVTSLSLWIDGKEEKGILTAKQNATKAYTTIVGKERRDPSVVHWQEGNTVTVRVFPCTTSEERKFKIGITSPLVEKEGEVLYKNVGFRGPSPDESIETTRVRFLGPTENISWFGDFKKDKKGNYVSEHPYDPDFKISFKPVSIEPNRFTFDGHTYSIASYVQEFKSLSVKNIYLDINNAWTESEIEAVMGLSENYNILVYADEGFSKVTRANRSPVEELLEQNFSLFPFHLIDDTEHALVITKGKLLSPHLLDFKDSMFGKHLQAFFAGGKKVNVYNLSESTSAYINSLRELRGIEFAEGDISTLMDLLKNKQFPDNGESESKIILHDSKIVLQKSKRNESGLPDNAPDHLARLFAYNNIMRKVGATYFKDEFINSELIAEASAAYVVSPVSSLIVLESQEDYTRFGIRDTENSLHNAGKDSSGAVPEPAEWALIILFIAFVIAVKIRQTRLRSAI